MEITLEAKFDITHELKSNTLYHVTEKRYLDNILKKGLIPKPKNVLTEHPERIYFTYNIEDSQQYINNKSLYYKLKSGIVVKSDFIILKIELPKNNITFFEDPNFTNKGVYTYDNINPKYISVI